MSLVKVGMIIEIGLLTVRWSWFVGQFGGLVKVYSGC